MAITDEQLAEILNRFIGAGDRDVKLHADACASYGLPNVPPAQLPEMLSVNVNGTLTPSGITPAQICEAISEEVPERAAMEVAEIVRRVAESVAASIQQGEREEWLNDVLSGDRQIENIDFLTPEQVKGVASYALEALGNVERSLVPSVGNNPAIFTSQR